VTNHFDLFRFLPLLALATACSSSLEGEPSSDGGPGAEDGTLDGDTYGLNSGNEDAPDAVAEPGNSGGGDPSPQGSGGSAIGGGEPSLSASGGTSSGGSGDETSTGGSGTGGSETNTGSGGGDPIGPVLTAEEFYNQWKVQYQAQTGGSYTNVREEGDESGQSWFVHDEDYSVFTLLMNEGNVPLSDTKSRVELRELDGEGDEIAWSQAGTHTLVSSVRILNYTLHDRERDVIVLQAHTTEMSGADPFDGGSSDSFGTGIYFRPGSNKFECKVRDSGGEDAASDLVTNISDSDLAMFHTLRIQVRDGESRCGYFDGSVWYNTPYSDLIGGRAYFKTGNYTQEANSTSASGDATEVQISGVSVEHP